MSEPDIFCTELPCSCYFGRMIEEHSDDWVLHMQGEKNSAIGVGGDNLYNMAGISYFCQTDTAKIAQEEAAYQKAGHEGLYWEEVANGLLRKGEFNLGVHEVPKSSIVEIDSAEELKMVDKSY